MKIISNVQSIKQNKESSNKFSIEFWYDNYLGIGTIVGIELENKTWYYKINSCYVYDKNRLYYMAVEYDYRPYSKQNMCNIIKLMGCFIHLVDDPDTIKKLANESTYC